MNVISAEILLQEIQTVFSGDNSGKIIFNLGGISVIIKTTDTVGNSLQSWLKEFMISKKIYFREPINTQTFPDFYLSASEERNLLEVKSFNFEASPAFDIANFESYVDSVKIKPYRLDADYLIFGYTMNEDGEISINKIWMKKIWELCGSSDRYPLKTQIKREVIYNIRPSSKFRQNEREFNSKEEFILALYKTLRIYRGVEAANNWLMNFKINYRKYYNIELGL